MSVRLHDNGHILLEGHCPAEDAENLLQLLQINPGSPVDWTQCAYLHTAVLQVILAVRPARVGSCGDAWVRQWVVADP